MRRIETRFTNASYTNRSCDSLITRPLFRHGGRFTSRSMIQVRYRVQTADTSPAKLGMEKTAPPLQAGISFALQTATDKGPLRSTNLSRLVAKRALRS